MDGSVTAASNGAPVAVCSPSSCAVSLSARHRVAPAVAHHPSGEALYILPAGSRPRWSHVVNTYDSPFRDQYVMCDVRWYSNRVDCLRYEAIRRRQKEIEWIWTCCCVMSYVALFDASECAVLLFSVEVCTLCIINPM